MDSRSIPTSRGPSAAQPSPQAPRHLPSNGPRAQGPLRPLQIARATFAALYATFLSAPARRASLEGATAARREPAARPLRRWRDPSIPIAAEPVGGASMELGSAPWGPMQFLPATFTAWAVDADGDGMANPHDLDGATGSAAHYLCGPSGRIDDERSALRRRDHDERHVWTIIRVGRRREHARRPAQQRGPRPSSPATPSRKSRRRRETSARAAALAAPPGARGRYRDHSLFLRSVT